MFFALYKQKPFDKPKQNGIGSFNKDDDVYRVCSLKVLRGIRLPYSYIYPDIRIDHPWCGEVYSWWDNFVTTEYYYKKKHLYIYGPSNVGLVKLYGKVRLQSVMWILDNFDLHHIRHINPGGTFSQGEADKLGGYYNSKYNEENLPGGGAYHFPAVMVTNDLSGMGPKFIEYFYDNASTIGDVAQDLWNPPKTKDVGETTVASFKKKIVTPRYACM
ncbi:hypothetical protein O3M35_007741 [Rhynocoris fuscipes]|uniref:Uncharacterized protein n=1 Tax=Rhynocoris fuscipes TaxID=488301 RepID=A0AAW1DG66_9HEMI